ncbi:hypothetical protein SAMN02910400_01592 [Lachnospiraceae bacterium C10]|nr:hypothetical protein SAMN02910400_01592 [Lachnospiraceae bacterium C10]
MVKSTIKNCMIHLTICTLAITTIMTFIPAVNKKVTAEAAATNTDAEHVDFEYIPGALEWAGSQSRTGIAAYIVSAETGQRVKEPVVLLWGDDQDWQDEINAGSGGGLRYGTELRRGSIASTANRKSVKDTPLKNMPCPVSGDGNIWSSRSNYMKNWMDGASKADKKLTNAAYIAENLFDTETFKNLKVGSGDNGDSKWKMVFETVSAHALYKIHNGKDVVQSYDDGGDGKKHPFKVLKSAYEWCEIYDYNGIDITQRYGAKGTANSKWMQSVLKSYGVLNDYAVSINKISPTSGSVPASQGIREGWATGVANQLEIPIETSTTGGSPSEIETPNESLGTDGDCIIHKTYITKKKYADGHVEYQPADECKEKYQTSNYVHVVAEEGKYSLASWKSSNQNQSTPRTIEEYKSIPAGHLSGSNDAYIHLMTNFS